jgi:hypothetical protein
LPAETPAGGQPTDLPQWLIDAMASAGEEIEGAAGRSQGPNLDEHGLSLDANVPGKDADEDSLSWLRSLAPDTGMDAVETTQPALGDTESGATGLPPQGSINPDPRELPLSHPKDPQAPASGQGVLSEWLRRAQADLSAGAPPDQQSEDLPSTTIPDWLDDLRARGIAASSPEPANAQDLRPPEGRRLPEYSAPLEPQPKQPREQLPAWLVTALEDQRAASSGSPAASDVDGSALLADRSGRATTASEGESGISGGHVPVAQPGQRSVEATPGEDRARDANADSSQRAEAGLSEDDSLPSIITGGLRSPADAERLFIQLPEWLARKSTAAPQPEERTGARPAALPSWLEGMLPADAASLGSDLELPGLGSTRTEPKPDDRAAFPIAPPDLVRLGDDVGSPARVDKVAQEPAVEPQFSPPAAAQTQRTDAPLLEQLLGGVSASPIRPELRSSGSSRLVNGLVGAILLAVAAGGFFLPRPALGSMAPASDGALQALQELRTIPPASPILVAVEYGPARVAEMEAAAAPLLEDVIARRQPTLALISTSAIGPLLAQRIVQPRALARANEGSVEYSNLGYLPGGVMGLAAFARAPLDVMPSDFELQPTASLNQFQGLSALEDFSALIVITDSAETARAWIEQTIGLRGAAVMVVVASAQAAPLIEPYYRAGEIDGLVSGITDAGGLQKTTGRPAGGTATYSGAYPLGMLVAAAILLIGGTWYLLQALRRMVMSPDRKPSHQ